MYICEATISVSTVCLSVQLARLYVRMFDPEELDLMMKFESLVSIAGLTSQRVVRIRLSKEIVVQDVDIEK